MKKIFHVLILCLLFLTGTGCSWFQKKTATDATPNNSSSANIKATRPMTGQNSFGLSVCEEVPKSLVAETINKEIVETEDWSGSTDTGCKYYINKEKLQYVLVNVTYLSAEKQKKGRK